MIRKIAPVKRFKINTRQISSLPLVAFAIVTSMMLMACTNSEIAPMESLSMVDTFHSAINSDDVDTALALFTDDAIVVDGESVIQGKDEIRNWVLYSQRMDGLRLRKLNSAMVGEKVSWLDIAHDGPKLQSELYLLRWEALIQDGKFYYLTAIPG